MRNITSAAVVLGLSKLAFSTALLAFGKFRLDLGATELQTLAFVTLVFGNQAVLYVLRERRAMWASMPGRWVLASSALDIAIVSTLALSGILMAPLPAQVIASIFVAAIGFAFILDRIKLPVTALFKVE
jgi:H+-transporting ATPase